MTSEPVVLGRISGLFGVRGWVKVFSYTDPREAVLQYENWMLCRNGEWRPAKVAEGQRHGKSVIARLDGVDDREQAKLLVDADIGVAPESMPKPNDGHYYWSDIIGLTVEREDGDRLGDVTSMIETGAHDVMVVQGDKERLIPFVKNDIVLEVDFDLRRVKVNWEWD